MNTIYSRDSHLPGNQWPDSISSPEKTTKHYLKTAFEHYKKGEYEIFRKYNDSVIPVAQKFGLEETEVDALINLGIYFSIMGKYEKSLAQYHKAMEKCESLPEGEKTGIDVLVNMGNIYNNIGSYDKAIAVMEKVLARAEHFPVQELAKLSAYNGLGSAYSNLGDQDMALYYYLRLKELGEQTENTEVTLAALNNMTNAYLGKKEYEQAIKTGLECLEKSPRHRAAILVNLGIAYRNTGNPEKAAVYLEEAKEAAITENDKKAGMRCRLQLAKAYEDLGYFEKSYREQKQYAEMLEKDMLEKTGATRLDLEQEARLQHRDLNDRIDTITALIGKKNKVIAGSFLVLALLGGLLFFYLRKKKVLETDRERIRTNYLALYNENKTLKTRMKALASKKRQAHRETEEIPEKGSPQYKNSSLTEKDRKQYMDLILDHMESEKPYLDCDITPSDLALTLSISVHHLSEILNLCFEQNFYNFINIYRVNESQRLMRNPDYNDYKILAIAYEAGFKSKTSFNRVFKNHTGLTPTQYRKKYSPALASANPV